MSDSRRVRVVVRLDRADPYGWSARVEGLPAASVTCRSLATVQDAVRRVLARAGPPVATAPVEWVVQTGDPDLDREAVQLRTYRAAVAAAGAQVATRTRALAYRLVSECGLSVRDAATLLGVSPARVSQLVRRDGGR